eukprot:5484963-Amphidinium_carterae.1
MPLVLVICALQLYLTATADTCASGNELACRVEQQENERLSAAVVSADARRVRIVDALPAK